MLPPPPRTSETHLALLDLTSGTLCPLSGEWPWVGGTSGEPVALECWLGLVHPGERWRLEHELERAVRLGDGESGRLSFRLRPPVPLAHPEAVRAEAGWQVVRRAPDGQPTHLNVALRLLADGEGGNREEEALPAVGHLPVGGQPAILTATALIDTATFTWTGDDLQVSPVLSGWVGATPTALPGLLAHLDGGSARALQAYLHGPDPAAALERRGELRGVDGQVRPVLLCVPPPMRVAGERVAFGLLRDLGETLRLREALADRERRLGETQALARLGSWRTDLRSGGQVWSEGLFHLLGLPVGEPDPAAWLALTQPEDRAALRAALAGDWEGEKLFLRCRLLRPGNGERVIEVRGRVEPGPDGQPAGLSGTARDVTGQVRAGEREREARRLQAALLDAAAAVTATLDQDEVLARLIGSVGRIVPFGAASVMLLGPDGDTLRVLLRRCGPDVPPGALDLPHELALSDFPALADNLTRGLPCVLEDVRTAAAWPAHPGPGRAWIRSLLLHPIRLEGRLLGLLALMSAQSGTFTPERAESVRLFMGYVGAALHNSHLYGEARREAHRAGVLADLAAQLGRPLDPGQVAEVVAQGTHAALGRGCVSLIRHDPQRGEWVRAARVGFGDHPQASLPEVRDRPPLLPPLLQPGEPGIGTRTVLLSGATPQEAQVLARLGYRQALQISLGREGHCLAGLYVGLLEDAPFTPAELALLGGIAEQTALAFVNADLRAENAARVRDLTVLNLTAQRFAQLLDEAALADALVDTATEHFGADSAWVVARTPQSRLVSLSPRPQPLAELGPDWRGLHPARAALSGGPVVLQAGGHRDWWQAARACGIQSAAVVPVPLPDRDAAGTLGLLLLSREPHAYTPQRLHVLSTLVHHFGSVLRTARLFRDTRQRLARLEALHDLDTLIGTAQDLGQVMRRVAELATAQPGVSAAAVCLRSPHTPHLEYVAAQGLDGPLPGPADPGGEGPPATVALEGRPLRVPDLPTSSLPGPQAWPRRTGARGYQALPLGAKGQVLGVLEYTWHGEEPDPQTHVFLRVVADQAAIASESMRLYRDLQCQSDQLTLAYDETLEGWSRALDLRDKETEGHTRRVTELTLRLARAYGLDPADLTHIRRGALLHDIGKMGIPDVILHKPGPLDAGEWEVMKRHPQLALELLSPTRFLRPALDIPACHHEKWDGSGYPRGLKGEAIPLPARLFAVVDVWDALTSDRPYRLAWTPARALAHIRAESGTHFDPRVVDVFTALILETHPELAGEA